MPKEPHTTRAVTPQIPYAKLPPSREQELLNIAQRLFIEHGYGNTSMDQLVREAGMSKSTVYRRYPNKSAILEAVVIAAASERAKAFNTVHFTVADPEGSLRQAAAAIRAMVADNLEIIRLVIAEARRNPELGYRCRKIIGQLPIERLSAYFNQLIAAGNMLPCDTLHAANFFLLTLGRGMRPLFNALSSDQEESVWLEWDLAVFCRGYGIELKSKTGAGDAAQPNKARPKTLG
jgi:AcrR family transcriptional regulator